MKYVIDGIKKVEWNKVKKGDKVFIAGNLINGIPTYAYGPHYVVDVERRILKNGDGRTFFERWPYLFVEDQHCPPPPFNPKFRPGFREAITKEYSEYCKKNPNSSRKELREVYVQIALELGPLYPSVGEIKKPLDLSVSAWVEEVKKGKTIIGYARWVLKERK